MKTFTLNGKVYQAKEFGFNVMCDFEERGISLEDIEKKPMSMMRYYIALCMNSSDDVAGTEIEAHLINGGKLEDIANLLSDAMENSGFFQALSKRTEKKAPASKSKKTEKVVAITEA